MFEIALFDNNFIPTILWFIKNHPGNIWRIENIKNAKKEIDKNIAELKDKNATILFFSKDPELIKLKKQKKFLEYWLKNPKEGVINRKHDLNN